MASAADLIEALFAAGERAPKPLKFVLTDPQYDRCVAEFGAEEVAKWAIRAPSLPPNEAAPPRS